MERKNTKKNIRVSAIIRENLVVGYLTVDTKSREQSLVVYANMEELLTDFSIMRYTISVVSAVKAEELVSLVQLYDN